MYKIGFAGTDARTFLSTLVASTAKSETGENNFYGYTIRGKEGVDGISAFARQQDWPVEFIPTEDNSADAYAKTCIKALKEGQINCVLPMPESLLFNGIVDKLEQAGQGKHIIGLNTDGVFLESDKIAGKEFCDKYGIPIAEEWYKVNAKDFKKVVGICLNLLNKYNGAVLKYPYSASGKGARIITSVWEIEEVYNTLIADYKKSYKEIHGSGEWSLLIESMMGGVEISFTVLVDRNGSFQILPTAMDYPERFEGPAAKDNPITGGMGSISPHPMESPELIKLAAKDFVEPAIEGMRKEGILRPCVLYPGCFIQVDKKGKPVKLQVSEINIRPGEPELQPVVKRIRNWGDLIRATVEGELDKIIPEMRENQVSLNMALVIGPGGPEGQRGYPWSTIRYEPFEFDTKYLSKQKIQLIPSGVNRDNERGFYSDGSRVAFLNSNAKLGQKDITTASEELRGKMLRALDMNKVRVIPEEDEDGNRLEARRDIGLHYSFIQNLFK